MNLHLNDYLYAGPFVCWDSYMSDIKQAFLNVVILDEDRDYVHFLIVRRSIFNKTKSYYFTFSPGCVWYY